MDLSGLSWIFTPASLEQAGVPTASAALLSPKATRTLSTHVITSGNEDEDTLYQAASISKAITATAVAKPIDLGHLTYSTKIEDYLPQEIINLVVESEAEHDFRQQTASRLPQEVLDLSVESKTRPLFRYLTVSHLLPHNSGLSQHGFPGYDVKDELPTAPQVVAGMPPANTPKLRFTTFPGAHFSYSGGGFVILQLFLEALLA